MDCLMIVLWLSYDCLTSPDLLFPLLPSPWPASYISSRKPFFVSGPADIRRSSLHALSVGTSTGLCSKTCGKPTIRSIRVLLQSLWKTIGLPKVLLENKRKTSLHRSHGGAAELRANSGNNLHFAPRPQTNGKPKVRHWFRSKEKVRLGLCSKTNAKPNVRLRLETMVLIEVMETGNVLES